MEKNDKGLKAGVSSGLSHRTPCGDATKRTGQSSMEGKPSAPPKKQVRDGMAIK